MKNYFERLFQRRRNITPNANGLQKGLDTHQHIAILFNGNIKNIITSSNFGYNQYTNNGNSKHAEVHAIENDGASSKKSIFVGRTNGSNSQPCLHCTIALSDYGIKKVYYTNGISSNGEYIIAKTSVSNLLNDNDPHISCGNRDTLECECDDSDDEEGKKY